MIIIALVSSSTFIIGVAIGAFLFDCLVSRPSLRIVNQEFKEERGQLFVEYERVTEHNNKLAFEITQLRLLNK